VSRHTYVRITKTAAHVDGSICQRPAPVAGGLLLEQPHGAVELEGDGGGGEDAFVGGRSGEAAEFAERLGEPPVPAAGEGLVLFGDERLEVLACVLPTGVPGCSDGHGERVAAGVLPSGDGGVDGGCGVWLCSPPSQSCGRVVMDLSQ
jgi:hypothetical protein